MLLLKNICLKVLYSRTTANMHWSHDKEGTHNPSTMQPHPVDKTGQLSHGGARNVKKSAKSLPYTVIFVSNCVQICQTILGILDRDSLDQNSGLINHPINRQTDTVIPTEACLKLIVLT